MATTITQYPAEYLSAIDEVLMHASYAGAYNVGAAEFAGARQVSVPTIDFGADPEPTAYDRFKTEADVKVDRATYTLDHDVQKVFYTDAVDAIDEAAAQQTRIISEYERTVFAPYVDRDFFKAVAAKAKAKGTEAITAANVKGEVRKAREQFAEAGLSGGRLYMAPSALAALEDATDRQWSSETSITDTVGSYDGFEVYLVPSDLLQADLIAISGGTRTVRYVTKRVASYLFAPGQHTQGDGWLGQHRWVFGTIVLKNKVPGIYASKAAA